MAINWSTEKRNIQDLKDYDKNPRTFTEKGMADLKASLKSLGYIDPIAINKDGTIIGGHARKKTLIDLGLTEIDVRVPDRILTDKQIKEAIIRLNKNTAGIWNQDMLMEEFEHQELIEWGFERSDFNSFGSKTAINADEIPEEPSVAVTVLGDQWMLGDHTIRCGDSTNKSDVSALLGGCKPHLMVTDPPYGVNYDASWRDKAGINKSHQKRATGKVLNDDRSDWREAWELFPGDVAYIWHGALHASNVAQSLEYAGFFVRSQIIWAKPSLVMGRGHYHWQHEPCWYAVKEGATGHWCGNRKQTTLWQIENMHATQGNVDDGKTNHSTQKPVECMKRPMENNSEIGDSVYEPFSGSGTTIIAGEITGRKIYAMELNPIYVDMAVIRWQNFTGKKAIHAVTGKEFKSTQQEEKKAS